MRGPGGAAAAEWGTDVPPICTGASGLRNGAALLTTTASGSARFTLRNGSGVCISVLLCPARHRVAGEGGSDSSSLVVVHEVGRERVLAAPLRLLAVRVLV